LVCVVCVLCVSDRWKTQLKVTEGAKAKDGCREVKVG